MRKNTLGIWAREGGLGFCMALFAHAVRIEFDSCASRVSQNYKGIIIAPLLEVLNNTLINIIILYKEIEIKLIEKYKTAEIFKTEKI